MPTYVPLHIQSAYSLGRGTAPVEGLVDQAVLYGHDALALTDRNNLYGAVAFTRACRERGVRPILGAEVDRGDARTGRPGLDPCGATKSRSAVPESVVTLLVRDAEGYANLCRLLTLRMMDPDFRLASALAGLHGGLHVLVADPALLTTLARAIPGSSLWGELQAPRHGEPAFAAVADAARSLNIDTVATGAVTCLRREDHRLHATLTAIRENTLVERLTAADLAPREAYFKAPAAMASVFRRHGAALANTRRIAESCTFTLERKRWIFPDPPLPAGETAASHLRALCEAGFARRYGGRTAAPAERRGSSIANSRSSSASGSPPTSWWWGRSCASGASAAWPRWGAGAGRVPVTSYVLGITNVDPIRYGLAFERFLHEKRPDWPDLDVDLCWKRRDEVIEHVYAAYGRDRVAMISTHNTFGMRSAFREAAKAHGVANRTVDRLSRCVPHAAEVPLREASNHAARGREIPRQEPPWPQVLEQAEQLVGLPRHLGLHPGGIVIADAPLDRYVPLEEAAKGIVCTQFEMRAIEAVGLVKIDLLGNRALSTIQETVELVAVERGVRLDPDAFPHEDAATARPHVERRHARRVPDGVARHAEPEPHARDPRPRHRHRRGGAHPSRPRRERHEGALLPPRARPRTGHLRRPASRTGAARDLRRDPLRRGRDADRRHGHRPRAGGRRRPAARHRGRQRNRRRRNARRVPVPRAAATATALRPRARSGTGSCSSVPSPSARRTPRATAFSPGRRVGSRRITPPSSRSRS